MNAYAEHTPGNQSRASAYIFSGQQGKDNSPVQQMDNRPETIAQRTLQKSIRNNFTAKTESRSTVHTTSPVQMMRPHIKDVNREFLFTNHRLGTYLGPVSGDESNYRFMVSGRIMIIHEDNIVGYRPTVGRMHPPGQIRPPEENVEGRTQVFLSEGDLSGAMSLQRNDPEIVDDMVVTTFEQQPNYTNFSQNLFDLESLGVPFLPGFDLSNSQNSGRLKTMGEGGNIHFQMPRVPRATPGYSTQKLVHDTLSLPEQMERDDLSVSITTPQKGNYKKGGHNQIYGIYNESALKGTEMELEEEGPDDLYLEEFGYSHKQTTVDKSTESAKKRTKFKFVSKKTEHEDFHNPFLPDEDQDPPPMGGSIMRQGLEELF